MKKLLFILIILVLWSQTVVREARAAEVSFEASSTINEGEDLDVVVNVETDEVLVNSIEMIIDYDEDLLYFSGYIDENAVIKFWIDPPRAKEGKIYFSGIIPGGVNGLYDPKEKELSAVPLVHLFFRAKGVGEARFSFIDSKVLQHDGVGTPLLHEKMEAVVIIKDNPNKENIEKELVNDTIPDPYPEENSFDFTFWAVILAIISGIVAYKLLKYKA